MEADCKNDTNEVNGNEYSCVDVDMQYSSNQIKQSSLLLSLSYYLTVSLFLSHFIVSLALSGRLYKSKLMPRLS